MQDELGSDVDPVDSSGSPGRDAKRRERDRQRREDESRERAELARYEREEQRGYTREKKGWWSRRRSLDPRTRREILDQLFFEGDELVPYLWRFSVLLGLSVVIATLGLLADSTAVVIGAMLVAPLMTPILAIAASLVMGWLRRQGFTVVFVIVASIASVAVAYLVTMFSISDNQSALTPEVLARTGPTLIDLFIGIAAGAAGAYVLVRKEAVSALPGVAVAVALVPPLATIGVLLRLANWSLLTGAVLLYLTNLVAILLAATAVFLIMGFKPRVRDETLSRRVRFGIATAVAGVVIVGIPLGIRGYNEVQKQIDRSNVTNAINEQIENDPAVTLDGVVIDEDVVALDFLIDVPFSAVGIGQISPADSEVEAPRVDLRDALGNAQKTVEDTLGRSVELTVRGVPRLVGSTCVDYVDCDPEGPAPSAGQN